MFCYHLMNSLETTALLDGKGHSVRCCHNVFLPECPHLSIFPPSTGLATSASWQRRWSDGDVVDHIMRRLAEDEPARTRVFSAAAAATLSALFQNGLLVLEDSANTTSPSLLLEDVRLHVESNRSSQTHGRAGSLRPLPWQRSYGRRRR